MKNIKLSLVLVICFITSTVQAQQQEEKVLKPLPPAALTKSPGADKPSALPADKQVEAGAKPATASPAPALADNKEEMKGIEIKPADNNKQVLKNNDRPKTSTIEAKKKMEPAVKPKAPVALTPEG